MKLKKSRRPSYSLTRGKQYEKHIDNFEGIQTRYIPGTVQVVHGDVTDQSGGSVRHQRGILFV